ncbi:MAG: extracellular solute-binding protein [Alphaproteobacteria bacterium]|jgi:putative spermidine/putrescine transport system substrate-binding protein|nr:extracellular solute-binding protein [Alphaproteobacteria bacterium]
MTEHTKTGAGPHVGRRTVLAGTAAAAASAVALPGILRAQAPTLKICGWGGDWDTMFKESIVPSFEAATGATVEIDTGWPFMPKLLSSSPNRPVYDVLLANPHDHWKAFDAGFVEDTPTATQVPNLTDVYDYAQRDDLVGVTFLNSAVGIGYRRDLVDPAPTSWHDMFREEFAGKRGSYVMQNTLGAGFFLMLGELFGDGFTDADAMFDAVERLAPMKLVDFTGAMEQLMLSGEVEIGVINDADILKYTDDPEAPLAFANPEEGSIALEQTYSVTKGSGVKELAYAWVDHLLAPENQKLICEQLWMSPVNKTTPLEDRYLDALYISEEKVATLVTPDWNWFNQNFDRLNNTYMRLLAG